MMMIKKNLVTVVFTLLNCCLIYAQVGIGTNSPEPSAALDVDVTSINPKKGFLPPRLSTEERNAIESPAEGLVIYNTDKNCVQFYTGQIWYSLIDDNSATPSIYNPATGQLWMDRNLGASRVAISPTDSAAFGDLYQYGRVADGHEDRNSAEYAAVTSDTEGVANFEDLGTNPWDGQFVLRNNGTNNWVDDNAVDGSGNDINDLWQGDGGVNDPCPTGYKVPTEAEWENERSSWSSNDANGGHESIKLTMGGSRGTGGNLNNVGGQGQYWSSTNAKRHNLLPNFAGFGGPAARALGFMVRCIKVQD
jgi:hypothetical protein